MRKASKRRPRRPGSRSLVETRGDAQRRLLGVLLQRPRGATVAALVRALRIGANAVREHLAALARDGLVAHAVAPARRGRPTHVYRLTEHGQEAFPRRYGELAQSILDELGGMLGEADLRSVMRRSGARAARALAAMPITVERTAQAMAQLGYEARAVDGGDQIVAMNCVFHRLARDVPAVCEFDLAFMKAATGRAVEHRECMVRGGSCCRFAFAPPRRRAA